MWSRALLGLLALACAMSPQVVKKLAAAEAPASARLHFSSRPDEREIFDARVFDEPLLPMGGKPGAEETRALAEALARYADRAVVDDFSSLTGFLAAHPASKWRDSLLLHLGVEYCNFGFYSRALDAWEQAWTECKDLDDAKAKAQQDRVLGELVRILSKVGRMSELRGLLEANARRALSGPATQLFSAAKGALWLMENRPETSFRCGPLALEHIRSHQDRSTAADPLIVLSKSTTNGFSLPQVAELSRQLGMDYQMAFRSPGAPYIIPAVVHWKVGHYAALVERDGDRYLARDHTFQSSSWVTRNALDDESSGYFLVPPGPLPEGWRKVAAAEGGEIWGRGQVGGPDPKGPAPKDPKSPSDPCGDNADGGCDHVADPGPGAVDPDAKDAGPPAGTGMAVYDVTLLYVSLNIRDIPLGYTPPIGPPVRFRAYYNQAESHQPATFSYSNLGPKWTCNWIAYINDNPSSPAADVSFYVDGGGTYAFTGFDTKSQSYEPDQLTQAILVKTTASSYEMRFNDGSKKEFALSDGAVGSSRRVFLTQIIDPAGNAVTLNYDHQLRITNIVDAIGQGTTLLYTNAANPLLITGVVDPFGRSAQLQYNSAGLLSQITDVIGLASRFTYDANEFVTALATPYGTTTFTNGQGGGVLWLEATDPVGQTQRVEFNQNNLIPMKDPPSTLPHGLSVLNDYLAYRNTFYWDKKAFAEGRGDYSKAKIYHWCHTPDISVASRVLESVKQPLENRVWLNHPGQSLTSPYGSIIIGSSSRPSLVGRVLDDGNTQLYSYQYNAIGNLTNALDPVGRSFSYLFDTNNVDLLETRMTRNGKSELLERWTYNPQHLPLTVTDASGQTTSFAYSSRGQILSKSNPLGQVTTYGYDTNGYLLSVTGPLQNSSDVASMTWDAYGRIRSKTDTEGYTVTFDYDAMDRRLRSTYPDGTLDQYIYDRLDVVAQKDRLGRWTTNVFDPLRRLAQKTDPLGRVTQYEWCRCGAASSLIDPMGRQTTWQYDIQSRLTAKQYPDGSTVSYTYESSAGRVKSRVDENGQQTVYDYYADNSLARISYLNTAIPTPPVFYTYDPDYRRPLTIQDGIGATVYNYNSISSPAVLGAGRLGSVSGPLTNTMVSFQYDELGRPVGRTINGATQWTAYDTLGRVAGVTNSLGAFQYRYTGATARKASMSYPNGQTALYSYYGNSGDDRLAQIHNLNSDGTSLSSFGYGYDAVGEVTSWTNTADAMAPATWTFSHDAVNQLTNAVLTGSGGVLEAHSYVFDPVGNRLQEAFLSATNQFAYNSLNQLTARPAGVGGATYEWDAEQRLTAVNQGNLRLELRYDGRGRRVGIRSLVSGVEATNRFFVWSGYDICEEHDAGGAVIKRFFDQGVQTLSGSSAGSYFYTRDHLGSVHEVTAGSGSLASRFNYDPYGKQTQSAGGFVSDFGFGGHFYENSTRLTMTWFRLYDPTIGRWLSRDPFKGAELLQGPNLYAYVVNDPVNRIDPFGLFDWGPIGGLCCNSSGSPEYGIVGDGEWKLIPPGGCTSVWSDCDGLTCGGVFSKIRNTSTATCNPDHKIDGPTWGIYQPWSPGVDHNPAHPPGPCAITGKKCDTPPGYKWAD